MTLGAIDGESVKAPLLKMLEESPGTGASSAIAKTPQELIRNRY
jgi:hypothetical protein